MTEDIVVFEMQMKLIIVSTCHRTWLSLDGGVETKVVSVDRPWIFDERVQMTILVSACQQARLPLVDKGVADDQILYPRVIGLACL